MFSSNQTKWVAIIGAILFGIFLTMKISWFDALNLKIKDKATSWDDNNAESIRENVERLSIEWNKLEKEKDIVSRYKKYLVTRMLANRMFLATANNSNLKTSLICYSFQPFTNANFYSILTTEEGNEYNENKKRFEIMDEWDKNLQAYATYYYSIVNGYVDFNKSDPNNSNNTDTITYITNNSIDLKNITQDKQITSTLVRQLDTLNTYLRADTAIIGDRLKAIDIACNANVKKSEDYKLRYNTASLNINKDAIWVGLPLFILATIALYYIGNRKKGDENGGNSVQTITILLFILSSIILGLANVLKDGTLSTLFGALIGYVLGDKKNNSESQSSVPKSQAIDQDKKNDGKADEPAKGG